MGGKQGDINLSEKISRWLRKGGFILTDEALSPSRPLNTNRYFEDFGEKEWKLFSLGEPPIKSYGCYLSALQKL